MAHLVSSSTALTFLANMSAKRKSASPSAVQVKNSQKTFTSEEKLYIISCLEKGEQIVYICLNVRFAYSCIHTIRDNADRITESAKSGPTVLCSKSSTVLLERNMPKIMDVSLLHFYCIINR